MQLYNITTPFGRRPMTLAMMKGQVTAQNVEHGKSVSKWKVFRDVSEIRDRLGLGDRALAVLSALLSFYPEDDLEQGKRLVVFPSNVQLTRRAHGISGATLRRHLAALTSTGIILRKDSPNGKRYAHRSSQGKIQDAFGFDLAPLLARADEFARQAAAVREERQQQRVLKERFALCRRDIRKLIAVGIREEIPANWTCVEARFTALLATMPRTPDIQRLSALVQAIETMLAEVTNIFKIHVDSQNASANARQDEHHIQDSKTESHRVEEAETDLVAAHFHVAPQRHVHPVVVSLPDVLAACPQTAMLGPGGHIADWQGLQNAAILVSRMLNVSSSAYEAAAAVFGPRVAAIVIACIYERGDQIVSPGGYLRQLTAKARRGGFAVEPMISALHRRQSRPVTGEEFPTPQTCAMSPQTANSYRF